MSDLLTAARAALPGVSWLQLVGGRSLRVQGLADLTLDLPSISVDEAHHGHPILLHVAKTTWECVDAADMARTLRQTLTHRRDALTAALGDGWIPVADRKPAPLLPCEGCVFATIMQVHNPALAEAYDVEGCRRYPTIQRVDGLGCGERQEGGK